MLEISSIVEKKQRGCELSEREIDSAVQGYSQGEISDRRMGTFLKAVAEKGMTFSETVALTRSMVNSGHTVDLSEVPGPKVDKHSTGGVGDKTTLVVTPLVAACGVRVAKMSGRGLGFTGGTVEKLETIPGLRVDLSKEQLIDQLKQVGAAFLTQTADFVPADKRIYALRDKTGTVSSIPLIASSVMSKKIAAGADAIVLDVKMGSGAFMKTFDKAKELAEVCVSIGNQVGKKMIAFITNMNQPLGAAVGPSLELREAIEILQGGGPSDVAELSFALAAQMLILSGQAFKQEEARELLLAELDSGNALDKLAEIVEAQGGKRQVVEKPDSLPRARLVEEFTADKEGYISAMETEQIGWLAKKLVGLVFHRKVGHSVAKGDVIAEIHANRLGEVGEARSALTQAIGISDRAIPEPLIYSVIRP